MGISFQGMDGHWVSIFENLWRSVFTSSPISNLNPTGADVVLCCSDGKIALHRTRLQKFTVLLDMLEDGQDLNQLTDPYGSLTLVLPHLKLEVIHALSKLIYCGDSGNLTQEVMSEIITIIRPEYGGNQNGPKEGETISNNNPEESGPMDITETQHQPDNAIQGEENISKEVINKPQNESKTNNLDSLAFENHNKNSINCNEKTAKGRDTPYNWETDLSQGDDRIVDLNDN